MPLAGTSVANVTGAWYVLVYVGGANFLTVPFRVGTYISPLTISENEVVPSFDSNGYPINSTLYYTSNSTEANLYVLFTNVGSGSYNVTFNIITPQGAGYATVNAGNITGPVPAFNAAATIDINGYPAASDLGEWEVLTFINNNLTSPALIQCFFISS